MISFDDLSEPLERRLADGLARLAAAARQLDWQAAQIEGLSPTQAEILTFVVRRPLGVRLSAAAAHAGVRSPTASDAVAALERKALIGKHADATDGRAVLLKATPAGTALVQRWPLPFQPAVQGLDADDQAALLRLVVTMIRSLQLRNLIAPQRTCVTCGYYRRTAAPERHFCTYVGAPMADRHLRVDCPEHQAAAA